MLNYYYQQTLKKLENMATATSVGELKDTLAQYEAQFHQVIDVIHSFVAMTTYFF